jgi:hypothetical protein
MLLILKIIKIFKKYYQFIVVVAAYVYYACNAYCVET